MLRLPVKKGGSLELDASSELGSRTCSGVQGYSPLGVGAGERSAGGFRRALRLHGWTQPS